MSSWGAPSAPIILKLKFRLIYHKTVIQERVLALIAADILGWSLGCGGLARGGRSNAGTPLALATAPVNDQDSSEKQD
ncbi:hypothetical protein [Psychrobacter sp. KCTC 72983]|uniref:hypothetical protein n=1 Tax=Psychrobacter TaxID=497 RepID=UPI001649540E|nr:hypothetical protein [Psychrobacter sp. KCTC 72983]